MRLTSRVHTPGLFATLSFLLSLPAAADPASAPTAGTNVSPPTVGVAETAVPPPSPASVSDAPTLPNPQPAPSPAVVPLPAPAAAPAVAATPVVPAPPALVPPDPTRSIVHLASSHPGTALELKSSVDETDWQRVCLAPCDRSVVVLGMLARASAPGMTTSNVFRIRPGVGPALVKVEGGSSSARTLGIIGLAAGIPIALGGAALFSYGQTTDRDAMSVGGAVMLGTGALALLVALPLLVNGGTSVRDGEGRKIAAASVTPRF